MKTRQTILYGIFAVILALAFNACDDGNGEEAHTHSYSTAWSYNATQHWHECSCGDKADVADHDWNINTGLCNDNCGALYYNLGDTGLGGGKIFYRSATGFTMTDDNSTAHYLEAAPADMTTTLTWGSTDITGTATGIGTGRKNTALILATNANAPAAKACNDYSNGGKTDWFLPSKDELNQLYVNRTSVGNLKTTEDNVNRTDRYWSSSQSSYFRYYQQFSSGYQDGWSIDDARSVRAVRAF